MSDLYLRDVPEEIRKIILKEQVKEKEKRGINSYSITKTISRIIREWEECLNKGKEKK